MVGVRSGRHVNVMDEKARGLAWDGTAAEFWAAVRRVREHVDIESDQAVLADVLHAAQAFRVFTECRPYVSLTVPQALCLMAYAEGQRDALRVENVALRRALQVSAERDDDA